MTNDADHPKPEQAPAQGTVTSSAVQGNDAALAKLEAALATANTSGGEAQLSLWRAQLGFQVAAGLAFGTMFVLIITGMAKDYVRLPSPGDSMFQSIESYWGFIEPFHHYAGYALIPFIGGAGWSMWLMGKRLSKPATIMAFKVLGGATLVLGLVCPVIAAATGKSANLAVEAAREAYVMPPNPESTQASYHNATPPAFYDEQEAVTKHVSTSSLSLGAACGLILIGAFIAGMRGVKEAAGIKK